MAEITVSNVTPFVNENNSIHLEFLNDETPVVSSLDVARHFQKKHKHVLDDIHKIFSICPKVFTEPNFRPSEYADSTGRKLPAYLLTRDAFSLLVMGFTGSAAIRWKLKYIEAFNCLEAAVRDNIRADAVEYGRKLGLDEARALPAAEADRKAAYLDGMKEGEKLQKKRDGLVRLTKIKAYREKGLNAKEIGTLLGLSQHAVNGRIRRARKLGGGDMKLVKGKTSAAEVQEPTTLDIKREVKQSLTRLNFSDGTDPSERYYDVACFLRLAADALSIPHAPSEKGEIRLAVLHLLHGCWSTILDTKD